MEFTYKAYENLINLIKKNNYIISNYHNYVGCSKAIIIRHDVDSSLDKAVKLAKLEEQLEVKSTYFILLTSDFYNIASAKSYEKIKTIINCGHEIGLHYDEMKYEFSEANWEREIKDAIHNEISVMESILNIKIETVSMHRPSKKTLEADLKIEGVINSYSKDFFINFKYVSDSRRHWRENVEDIVRSKRYDRVHILTHAFWYNDIKKDIHESIKEFVNGANKERYIMQAENITDLDSIMKEEEVL